MHLETFMLADHAVAGQDGKLYINGGGITKLYSPGVPFALPFISLVLRFAITEDDVGEHALAVMLENPDGLELLPTDDQSVVVAPVQGDEDEQYYFQAVMSFGGLPILSLGTHTFKIRLDSDVIRMLKVPVVPAPRTVSPIQPSALS